MRVAVRHVTRLDFGDEITESVMDTRLGPRDDADQRVHRFQLRLDPPGHIRRYDDGFGNAAHLLTSMRPHNFVEVTAESEVQTYLNDPFQDPPRAPRALDVIELADYLQPSPLVPRLHALEELATPFRAADTFQAVRQLSEMIYRNFTYRAGVTDVTTSIERVIDGRHGVCQDFAQLLLGLCRAIDIPARYVSGYVVAQSTGPNDTPPSRGAGASHAWVEAFIPSHGWRGFDPTNNLVANEHYVKIAIGRDYHDVPPTRGTYHGSGDEHLTVSVTTHTLD
jgi:transglutaminase-like putative cysteine protease